VSQAPALGVGKFVEREDMKTAEVRVVVVDALLEATNDDVGIERAVLCAAVRSSPG